MVDEGVRRGLAAVSSHNVVTYPRYAVGGKGTCSTPSLVTDHLAAANAVGGVPPRGTHTHTHKQAAIPGGIAARRDGVASEAWP